MLTLSVSLNLDSGQQQKDTNSSAPQSSAPQSSAPQTSVCSESPKDLIKMQIPI